jgi:predicted DNA-binding transcriptional regulator AlpA
MCDDIRVPLPGEVAINDRLVALRSLIMKENTPRRASDLDRPAQPLLVSARQGSRMCGKSLRTWRTWDAAGWIPRPIRIGRSTLWRLEELREWIAAGCPQRDQWEARRGI